VEYQEKMLAIQAEQSKKLDTVLSEFTSNGGQSVRDGLNQVMYSVAEMEAVWRADSESADHGEFRADKEGHQTFLNRWYTNELYCSSQDLLRDGWISYIAESDRNRVVTEWSSCVQFGRTFHSEFSYRRSDGVPIKVVCDAKPIRSSVGVDIIYGWIGQCRLNPPPINCAGCDYAKSQNVSAQD
jgi:hypothetical protein